MDYTDVKNEFNEVKVELLIIVCIPIHLYTCKMFQFLCCHVQFTVSEAILIHCLKY